MSSSKNKTASLSLLLNLGNLSFINNKLKFFRELESVLREHLPVSMKPHCRLVCYQNHRLTLSTTSANWATRIQYQLPELQRQLKYHPFFSSLKEVRLKLSYPPVEAQTAQIEKSISEASIQSLEELAEATTVKALEASLRRLIKASRSLTDPKAS